MRDYHFNRIFRVSVNLFFLTFEDTNAYMGASAGWIPPVPNSFGPPGGFPFMPPPPWVAGPPMHQGSVPVEGSFMNVGEGEEEEEGGEVRVFLLLLHIVFYVCTCAVAC